MTPETKLSPCRCGSTNISLGEIASEIGGQHYTQSECQDCGAVDARTSLPNNKPDLGSVIAMESWNRFMGTAPADTAPLKRYRPTVGLGNSVGMSEMGKYNFIDCTDQDAYYLASDVDAREAARAIEVNALLLELDSAWDHVCQIENENVDVRVQAKRWDRLDKVREKIRHLKPAPKEQAL